MHAEYGRRGDLPGHQPRSTALSRTTPLTVAVLSTCPASSVDTPELVAIDGTPVNWAHVTRPRPFPTPFGWDSRHPKVRGGPATSCWSAPGYSNSSSAGHSSGASANALRARGPAWST